MPIFQVPQFIEREDKIVGPLTLRQFIFLAIPAILIFLLSKVLVFWLWFFVSAVLAAFGLALAFWKVNGQPFYKVVVNGIKFVLRPRLYVWQRKSQSRVVAERPKIIKTESEKENVKRLSSEELKKMAEKLNQK